MNKLKFVEGGNSKLPSFVTHISLRAGHTCPGAKECLSKAHILTGKVTDGPDTKFRCYYTSLESAFKAVRLNGIINEYLLRTAKTKVKIKKLILDSLPLSMVVRIHVGGDFFSQAYFDSWLEVAQETPHTTFYAYTKSLPFWVKRLDSIPDNFHLTASRGGKFDKLIDEHDLKEAIVLHHPDEAKRLNLVISKDDSEAYDPNIHKFAQLIHGTQPAGSEAALAIKKLKQQKIKYSYG